ncbi:hypothetical protein [Stygiolobus caldivivus]|uniref:Uncharacterized protein n=1 Tax=Stygiolobus caldivivus TaxID=2824673 RepID=A0A8D5U5J8_9CREN|nr:hypothetical protein [Stygiolobus caldivivus]BCU69896.1 hypothetical protein KN1_11930 [Stygiolobus caldivivus]
MSGENPFDNAFNRVRDMLNRVDLQNQVVKEVTGDGWRVRVIETKIKKNNGEEAVYELYGIYLGDKSVAISVSKEGKLKRVILNGAIVMEETDQTVKKRNSGLILDYENRRVTYTEGEVELWKGRTGFDAIKSFKVLKNESRELQ